MIKRHVRVGWRAAFLTYALAFPAASQPTLLDQSYRQMYDLNFAAAHRTLADWERLHPGDPMGPVSDAAAYLFAEFDRLHVLQLEFFSTDNAFLERERGLRPDPVAKRNFEAALDRGQSMATAALARAPEDENALFASLMRDGLQSDYLALIEKRNLAALSEIKQGRVTAQRLLAAHPNCYDAYLAIGVENYMLSLRPLPVRWLLRLGGAQTDKETGLERLRLTAGMGRYFPPFAKLLLAVAAVRDNDLASAKRILTGLASEFPDNHLYREELSKLK